MDIIPYNFGTLRLCGIWYEDYSFYPVKIIYRMMILFMIIQFTTSQLAELATMRGTLDEMAEVLFVCFTYIALCLKLLNFLTRRNDMNCMLDYFRMPFFQSKSVEEEEIIKKYKKTTRKIFVSIMSLSQAAGWVLHLVPLLAPVNLLPFRAYQPYNVSNELYFAITYAMQVTSSFLGILLNVSMDTMAYGFMILAAAQFEMNCHRLENSTMSLRDCIQHYVQIRDVVLKIESFFIRVIVPLFCLSLIILCTSIFQMSQKKVASFEFISLALYFFCMFYQVFFYCWYGNEVELKNQIVMDAIYSSKWFDCDVKERKNIWFLMLFTRYGTNISFHGQCGLTLETFLWIVKTSYASFNLLQQASGDK